MQRNRPADSIQGFMSSFRQFEKKLDKLQDDVRYHGNTLTELRTLVGNLAVAMNVDQKTEDTKRPGKRNTAIQYEARFHLEEPRMRRKNALQPLPTKVKAKSFQDQKYGLRIESPFRMQKLSSPVIGKHGARPGKAEAPRKATTLKGMDKKRIKHPK